MSARAPVWYCATFADPRVAPATDTVVGLAAAPVGIRPMAVASAEP